MYNPKPQQTTNPNPFPQQFNQQGSYMYNQNFNQQSNTMFNQPNFNQGFSNMNSLSNQQSFGMNYSQNVNNAFSNINLNYQQNLNTPKKTNDDEFQEVVEETYSKNKGLSNLLDPKLVDFGDLKCKITIILSQERREYQKLYLLLKKYKI
jgi:hypothetical protein